MKIKNQLLLTHGILVALALAIVFINICTYKDMENDSNIINQAGKLRMLSYNMAHLSNQITTGNDPVHEEHLATNLKLIFEDRGARRSVSSNRFLVIDLGWGFQANFLLPSKSPSKCNKPAA